MAGLYNRNATLGLQPQQNQVALQPGVTRSGTTFSYGGNAYRSAQEANNAANAATGAGGAATGVNMRAGNTDLRAPDSYTGLIKTAPGAIPITQGAYDDSFLSTQNARQQADAESRRLSYLQTLGIGNAPPEVGGPSGGMTEGESAARSAAFARAKEQAGQTAAASVEALKNVMAGSGRAGSSMEAEGLADVVSGARGEVNEFTRDQLIMDLARAAELADTQYQGRITQRGQNMSMTPSILGMLTASGTAY